MDILCIYSFLAYQDQNERKMINEKNKMSIKIF